MGEPVRVRKRDLSIEGEGGEDRYLKEDLAAFAPNVGEVFDHTTYEASKLVIVRRLAELHDLRARTKQLRGPAGGPKLAAAEGEISGRMVIVADGVSKSFGGSYTSTSAIG